MAWIKLDRSIKDHWLWNTDEPFTKGQAWTDLLIHANYKDRTIHIKGQQVQLLRGQQARSELALSKVWGWSKNKVRRFLKLLKNEGMIDQQANHLTSIITICNYDKYQSQDAVDETSSGTSDETSSGTSDEHLTEHGIRSKEVKKEKNNPPKSPKGDELPEDFEEFWDAYPKRVNKSTAVKAFKRLKPDSELLEKIFADLRVRCQTEDWRKEDGKFIPHPSTYLNQRRWEDEIKPKAVGKKIVNEAYHRDTPEILRNWI